MMRQDQNLAERFELALAHKAEILLAIVCLAILSPVVVSMASFMEYPLAGQDRVRPHYYSTTCIRSHELHARGPTPHGGWDVCHES